METSTKASSHIKKHLKGLKYIDAFRVNKTFNINTCVSEHEGAKGQKVASSDEFGTRIGGVVTIFMVLIILYNFLTSLSDMHHGMDDS